MTRALHFSLMALTAALCFVCLLQWQREAAAGRRERQLRAELAGVEAAARRQAAEGEVGEQKAARLEAALAEEVRKSAGAQQEEARRQEAARGEQGAQLRRALEERDALAQRLNERTREFNALAEKYRQGK